MTGKDFVSEIIQEQENTRADIRALAAAVAESVALLRQVVKFQAAQDERETLQAGIAKDTTRIADSITLLVEGQPGRDQEIILPWYLDLTMFRFGTQQISPVWKYLMLHG